MMTMDTAPKDGTRILIKTVTFGWNTSVCQHVATGDKWVEARWGKGLDGKKTWLEWCGAGHIHTTSILTPIGWAPVPENDQLLAAQLAHAKIGLKTIADNPVDDVRNVAKKTLEALGP